MTVPAFVLRDLAPHIRGDVLSLGYPDIVATQEEIESIFNVKPLLRVVNGVRKPLVETRELFEMLGARFTCVDIHAWRGIERICDLNVPQDLGKYDLVIDAGTTEHCFNIGTAIMNAANAVKPGGRIYHGLPLFMMNHGFYNICPTALQSFYEQNGWRVDFMEARKGGSVKPAKTGRHFEAEAESIVTFMAQRLTARGLTWPLQQKYRKAA